MNRKKIFTKKRVTGTATLLVAIAIILTGTFTWKDFSQSAINTFLADTAPKHWVSLVDDFKLATTNAGTKTLTGWKRGDVSEKAVYVSSDYTDTKTDRTWYDADAPTTDYKPVYVRVKLTQTINNRNW